MTEAELIDAGMAPLFKRATREGLWFRSRYQGVWFSPKELRKAQASGKFRWGAVNWELLPPSDYLAGHEAAVKVATDELAKAQARVKAASK